MDTEWKEDLESWLEPFLSALGHKTRRRMCRMGLIVRTIGIARATVKIGMANLVYNFPRLAWLEGRTAPA